MPDFHQAFLEYVKSLPIWQTEGIEVMMMDGKLYFNKKNLVISMPVEQVVFLGLAKVYKAFKELE